MKLKLVLASGLALVLLAMLPAQGEEAISPSFDCGRARRG